MKRLLTLMILVLLFSSHELFLKTDSYLLEANEPAELYLYNGTFDTSENTITRDRIVNAKVMGPGYRFLPADADYHDQGNVTCLRFVAGGGGTYVAGISTLPRMIELNAADFREYLEHEGLTGVIRMREKKGISDSPAREKYSKHVKAILQVAGDRSGDFATELGYPIEFIPLDNPYEKGVGDSISFKLLLGGKPLPGQVVHYSSRQDTGKNINEENSTLTDISGCFTIKLSEPGTWYIATIHMTESQADDMDYESSWATLTFEIDSP